MCLVFEHCAVYLLIFIIIFYSRTSNSLHYIHGRGTTVTRYVAPLICVTANKNISP